MSTLTQRWCPNPPGRESRGRAAFPAPGGRLVPRLLAGWAAIHFCGLPVAATAAPVYQMRVLADGLQNPRGLTLAGNHLLVSEAGSGGPRQSQGSNCILSGSGAEICSGTSGSIGVWDLTARTYTRVLTGLPSLAQADGSEGTGIADLAVGGPTGLLGVFGLGGDPGQPNVANLGSNLFGQVVSINLSTGAIQPRSNLATYEKSYNPDGRTYNSNPYALELFADRLYATDAGGNSLLRLDPTPAGDGSFAILGRFVFPPLSLPPLPFQPEPVPTGLAVDPTNHQLLIAQLAGYPFVPGSASVYSSDGQGDPSLSLSGFSSITDIAAAADGSLYVLQYASDFFHPAGNGSVWRVAPDGSRESVLGGLTQPTGLAVAPDGSLYVTNNSDSLQGELREYRPVVPGPLPLLGMASAWCQARRLRRRRPAAKKPH